MKLITSILRKSPPYIFTLVVLLSICWLTLMPKPLPDNNIQLFPGADKVAHFIIFGAFAGALFIDIMRAGTKRHAGICAIIAAFTSSCFGIAVEFLQMAMDMGRSAEFADVVADTLGAVSSALIFYLIDRHYFRNSNTRCVNCIPQYIGDLRDLKRVYLKSFPAAERRDWKDIVTRAQSDTCPMKMSVVMLDGNPVGFITFWNLGDFTYIEHFVIDPALRNRGIGAKALRQFCTQADNPVVLEAEPAGTGKNAARRVQFYERLGFKSFNDYNYVQLPYGIGLPSVPLILMSTSEEMNPEEISSKLHKIVYEQA
ncbi:MAG: GNAT family N-acetyltransferase [Paramuribaculum sp.]|nr:GNAT family N-acetyltransferase [Paramuribaculum sp.]